MKPIEFRVQMFKSIEDSGWVRLSPLTVLVGKNESGKTTLLTALHKFNPFKPEPYSMDQEWPRGRRAERDNDQVVCSVRFEFDDQEKAELRQRCSNIDSLDYAEVSRTYGGQLAVSFPVPVAVTKASDELIEQLCARISCPPQGVTSEFLTAVDQCRQEALDMALRGEYSSIPNLCDQHIDKLNQQPSIFPDEADAKTEFIGNYPAVLSKIAQDLASATSTEAEIRQYVLKHIPTFLYMSDYRSFTGSAQLDLVKDRRDREALTEEDQTLIMIMELAGLDLDEEVEKAAAGEREQRQYDLDDASATLTKTISDRWRQRRYQVQLRADGPHFYTFVKDEDDPSLIKLEERSRGFQWFFSFDLMFMYESDGTFEGCVLLLDEPGLHLHPDAQKDLLRRLEEYARQNTLVYTTHLPFMIDLREPDRIRVMSDKDGKTTVTEDIVSSQPEARFVLQAALGMSGSSSYLLAERNLVVEGVDDYWIVTELSNLLERSGEQGLFEDVFVTPAGGASEAAYIATLMVGQGLSVTVLFDSDQAGDNGRDALLKKWITTYSDTNAKIIGIKDAAESKADEFAIEDLFTDDFYLECVQKAYGKQITNAGQKKLKLVGKGMICKRVERALNDLGIKFNKGSVAKIIRKRLVTMAEIDELPEVTREYSRKLVGAINASFGS